MPSFLSELKRRNVIRDVDRTNDDAKNGIKDVHILTLQGQPNAAIEALTEAVDQGFVSSQPFDGWSFDDDPIIEPLKSDPRFDVLRERMANKIDAMRDNIELAKTSGNWQTLLAKASLESI